MTTSNVTLTKPGLASKPGANFLPWIIRGLEGLWLFAALFVPLIFLNQDYAISEAAIAYVEVPKVALLRSLAGLIALLWLLEWAITSQAFQGPFQSISINDLPKKLRPSTVVSGLAIWIKVHPTRWLLLAAGMFFSSTFLSTVFSGSFVNSMWGEIPGQDGYSAYTIASYGVLFSVIATHLKSRAQLDRLLGAVVLMGFLVGLYGAFQYYGHDFLGTTESTGGGTFRITVFMGNAIFAGAVLSMTVPVTLVAAAAKLQSQDSWSWGPLQKVNQWVQDSMFTFLWAVILSVQFLGLIFTFSRGPWIGALLAIGGFLVLLALSSGLRMFIRTGLVLGLAGTLSIAFLHWQGNVTIINVGPWLGIAIAVLSLVATFAILFVINHFRRAITFIAIAGIVVTIIVAAVIAPPALRDSGSAETISESSQPQSEVVQRFRSIQTAVLDPGTIGGRATHWKISWELIKDRPWVEFKDLQLTSLRPLIGYGPDLFRYTYLLKSPAEDGGPGKRFLPLEPDHAHNFFIHQTVEQGIFGGVASLALFASAFGVCCHHLLRRRRNTGPIYRLLLFGLVTIFLGRFLEMMVGVARISDLTVLWVLFGLFVALVRFDDEIQKETESVASPFTELTGRRNRRRAIKASTVRSSSTALIFRLAIVAWLVGGIGIVTWQKSINSVRASVAEGNGVKHFQDGDLESSIENLDKAIKLAPGVPSYYSNRAEVSLAYQLRAETITEPGCAQQIKNLYQVCLGLQALNANLEAVNQQPFNLSARVMAANSALNLNLTDSALDLYQAAATLAPNSYPILNQLAEIQIDLGIYDGALDGLDRSLDITGESTDSITALHLKGRLFWEIQRYDDAVQTLKHGLSILYSQPSLSLMHDIYTMQGVINDIGYFDKIINENSNDSVAFYFRSLANLGLGNTNNAAFDMETASKLGFNPGNILEKNRKANRKALSIKAVSDARFSLAYYLNIRPEDNRYESALMIIGQRYLDLGLWKEAVESFTAFISISANNAASYKNRGDALFALMRYPEAIKDYEQAVALNSLDSVNSVALGKVYAALGDSETARLHFNRSIQLNPNSSDAYAARGFLSVQTGDYSTGLLDIGHAIQISPTNHDAYFKKSHAHIGLNQVLLALDNLDKAITLAPINSDYFYSRGLLRSRLNSIHPAIEDFTVSIELNTVMANNDPRYAKPYVDRGMAYIQEGIIHGDTEITDKELAEIQCFTSTIPASNASHFQCALIDADKALTLLEQQFNTSEWDYYKPTINLQLSDVHRLLGDSYTALDRTEDAQNEYEQSSKYRQ